MTATAVEGTGPGPGSADNREQNRCVGKNTLTKVLTPAGVPAFTYDANNELVLNTASQTLTGASVVKGTAATDIALTVKGASASTVDAFDVTDYAGTVLFGIGNDGKVKTGQTTAATAISGTLTTRKLALYNTGNTLLGYIPIYATIS
jgi:hypothetical protein